MCGGFPRVKLNCRGFILVDFEFCCGGRLLLMLLVLGWNEDG